MIETSSRHRLIGALKRLEAMFGVLVPEIESTVAACGGKGAHGMEGHSIDSIQFGVFRVRVLPVTLEGKVFGQICVLNVLDCHTALDAADTKAGLVGENGNTS